MIRNRFPAELMWIMEGGWVSVKFAAGRLCPKLHRERIGHGDAKSIEGKEKKQIPRFARDDKFAFVCKRGSQADLVAQCGGA
jgi:hypothetical protein